MMYPKPQRKKKRKKHKASILHCKDGTCYLCMKLKGDYRRYPVVHEHHIYDGPNLQNSEAEGLKVYLCLDHHIIGPEAVHNNHKNMRILHRDGQRAYERTHSRAEFMSLIGRNYLDEEKQEEPKKEDAPRPSVLAALEDKADKVEPVKPFKSYFDKEER